MTQGIVNKVTNSNTQAHLEKNNFFTSSNYVGSITQLQTSTPQRNTLKESTTSKIFEKFFFVSRDKETNFYRFV
jgi:hypothetical protein